MHRIAFGAASRLIGVLACAAAGAAWAGPLTLQPNLPQLRLGADGASLPTLPAGYDPPNVKGALAPGASARPGYLALATGQPLGAPGGGIQGPIKEPGELPKLLGQPDPMGAPGGRVIGPIRFPGVVAALVTPGITELRLRAITRAIQPGAGVDPLAPSVAYLHRLFPALAITTELYTPGGAPGAISFCNSKAACSSAPATPDPANVLSALYVGSFDWIRDGGAEFEYLYSLLNTDALVYMDMTDLARVGAGDTLAGLVLAGADETLPYFGIHSVGSFGAGANGKQLRDVADVTDDVLARYAAEQVPEPGTLALVAAALGAAGWSGRTRARQAARGGHPG